jgi:1-acyl-sn-glycerol-3-phosphate acyltransferase
MAAPLSDPLSWGVPKQGNGLYRGLRAVIRGALRAFYRTVEVTGRENIGIGAPGASGKPTILASTHPNSIVDPLLLGILEERPVTFCARDGLFKIPVFGALLRKVGAIPISRPEDKDKTKGAVASGGGEPAVEPVGGAVKAGGENAKAFAAARAVLKAGGVISIFPEGKTHDNLRVHRLRTGAARMALDAEAHNDWKLGVGIVPVALNYLVRQAFRSDVHVAFGPAIQMADLRSRYEEDPRGAARELTDRIEAALRELAVHVEQAEDERIIAQVTSIIVDIRREAGLDAGGQSPAERTALVRRIVDAYRWIQEVEPDKTAELRRRLQRFLEERSDLGLGGTSAALQHRTESQKSRFSARRQFLVMGFPVALWGLAGSLAPYLVLRGVLAVAPVRKDRIALTKLLVGAASFLGCWAVQAATLAPSALVALRWVTEVRLHRLGRGGIRALVRHADRVTALQTEREALKQELAVLRDRYLSEVGAKG